MTPVPTMAIRWIGLSKAMIRLLSGEFNVRDAREVALSRQERSLLRAVEPGPIDRAGEVREKHTAPFEVQRDANAFHEVPNQNLRGRPRPGVRIQWGAVDRVAARRVAAVRPVQEPVQEIELEVD